MKILLAKTIGRLLNRNKRKQGEWAKPIHPFLNTIQKRREMHRYFPISDVSGCQGSENKLG
jgi:hypothetical protein